MSSLINLPNGKILDYWNKKLLGKSYRTKFLLTKLIEISAFKSTSGELSGNLKFKPFPKAINNNLPDDICVSLIIPVYLKSKSDVHFIEQLIWSIANQIQKPDHIIIIDDCSPLKYEFPKHFEYIRLKTNSGPAKARNLGKTKALKNKTDIIAFTDSDCVLTQNWLKTIVSSFKSNRDYQILSGNTKANDEHWLDKYHDINGTLNGRKIKNTNKLLYGTTANLSITADVAISIDFNEKFPIAAGEDIEFCFRANQLGYAIKYIKTMVVKHNYGYNGNYIKNINTFRNQFKKYGIGEQTLLHEIPEYYNYFNKTEEIPAE